MRRQLLLLFAATLSLWGCASIPVEGDAVPVEAPVPAGNGKAEVGQRYVDFVAPTLSGEELRLSALPGKPVILLQFWGMRCAPCVAEMELLSRLQTTYGERGLRVVGINTDRVSPEQLSRALATRGIAPTYPVVLDPDFSISKRYTQWLIPVSVLIDRQGVVRTIHTGYRRELDTVIEAEVENLLGR